MLSRKDITKRAYKIKNSKVTTVKNMKADQLISIKKYELQTLPSNNDECIKHITHSNLNGCVTSLRSL